MPRKSQHDIPHGLEGYVPYETQDDRQASFYNRPWHIAKIALRGCNIVFGIIVIGLTAHAAAWLWYWSPFLLWFGAIPAAFAICWDSAELITICARGGRRGIHPGAHVGVHLVFCPVLAAGIAFESLQLWFSGYPDSWYGGDSIATKQHVALAFTCLLFLIHFILFVRACVETHQRNSRPPIYMVPISTPTPLQAAVSNAAFPCLPQQTQHASNHNSREMTSAIGPTETMISPRSDGTYFGPEARA
ncbi:hypothetical protein CTA2_12320 [Colletotrichum tanaceti]|uniref:Uncharacterized protein n=1 Tax=Colletotrichum tanaceti TaxID=1306861 RepID=A0A4U6XN47_9PEZI|nr:hypothetical protein CTA2_12320 [Colletotrichum tanaceti]TKW57112.1 hypothetical protein CTA1_7945 [Colletotrichum tanaceti]